MVNMKNFSKKGDFITLDAFMNGKNGEHFTMTIDLRDSSKYTASIDKCFYTDQAVLKVFYTYAKNGSLPLELVSMTH